jgi:hypothetical protein
VQGRGWAVRFVAAAPLNAPGTFSEIVRGLGELPGVAAWVVDG